MAQFDIFIDTNRQKPVRSFTDPTIVDLPPLVQGDTPTFRIWNLVQTATFQNSTTPYAYLGTAGLSLEVALGTRVGNSSLLYTQQFVWTPDANAQYFSAQFPLNTAGIDTLLSTNTQASAWFEVKYLSAGMPTTILDQNVQVQAAVIKAGALVVPPGQTALSAEEANAAFLKRKISGAIYLEDIANPGQYTAVFIQNGALKATPAGAL
jgi:hypothetical protein